MDEHHKEKVRRHIAPYFVFLRDMKEQELALMRFITTVTENAMAGIFTPDEVAYDKLLEIKAGYAASVNKSVERIIDDMVRRANHRREMAAKEKGKLTMPLPLSRDQFILRQAQRRAAHKKRMQEE